MDVNNWTSEALTSVFRAADIYLGLVPRRLTSGVHAVERELGPPERGPWSRFPTRVPACARAQLWLELGAGASEPRAHVRHPREGQIFRVALRQGGSDSGSGSGSARQQPLQKDHPGLDPGTILAFSSGVEEVSIAIHIVQDEIEKVNEAVQPEARGEPLPVPLL